MQTKFNNKFYALITAMIALLSSCSTSEPHYVTQGYKIAVTYDLGEGYVAERNENLHFLTVYYKSNSYITDFTETNAIKFSHKAGENCTYEIEGWYFDEQFTEKVDFTNYILPENGDYELTIYANWVAVYNKYFDIYFVDTLGNVQTWTDDDGNLTDHKSIMWGVDEPFEYSKNTMAYPTSETYTYIDAYKDEQMTQLVDDSYVFSADNTEETNKSVYLKWIKGDYKVINNASELKKNFGYYNLYINSDIDMKNSSLNSIATLKDVSIIGNNHTISNLRCSSLGAASSTSGNAVGGGLADSFDNVTISDLSFANVSYVIEAGRCKGLYYAPLAGDIKNSTLTNVSISGTMSCDEATQGKFTNLSLILDKASYNIDEASEVVNCSFNIVKE